jgi:hypothetical protein
VEYQWKRMATTNNLRLIAARSTVLLFIARSFDGKDKNPFLLFESKFSPPFIFPHELLKKER